MIHRVKCPSARCGEEFRVEEWRLGRNMYCPACGVRLTARPLDVTAKLEAQQERVRGEPGLSIPRLPLAVLVDNVRSLWNVGSIFRTADACGVQQILLAGITGHPPRAEISKTALGAEKAVAWRYRADAREALDMLVSDGYTPVAVENSPGASPMEALEWPARVGLVIGNEVSGVSPEVLEACPVHVSIPMRGIKDSLNVAVAFGVVAYHAARELEVAGRKGERTSSHGASS